MKKLLVTFVALIGGCVLFLLSPQTHTYSYFTDTKTIPIDLKLHLLSIQTHDTDIQTNNLNIKLSKELVTTTSPSFSGKIKITLDSPKSTGAPYFDISFPDSTETVNGEGKTIMTLTKKANLPENLKGKFLIYLNTSIQMSDHSWRVVNRSRLEINDSASTDFDWPSDFPEDKTYYISQPIYYSTINNTYTQLNTGTIFIKFTKDLPEKNTSLNNNSPVTISEYMKKIAASIKIGDHEAPAKVSYIPKKGFKINIDSPSDFAVATRKDALFFKMDWISSELPNIEFGNVVYPFLFNTDFNTNQYQLGTSIQESISIIPTNCTTLFYTSQQHDGVPSFLASINFDQRARWNLTDNENFEIVNQTNKSITIRQKGNHLINQPKLQLLSTDGKNRVLFEKKIISVATNDFTLTDSDWSHLGNIKYLDSTIDIQSKVIEFNYTNTNQTSGELRLGFKYNYPNLSLIDSSERTFLPIFIKLNTNTNTDRLVSDMQFSKNGLYAQIAIAINNINKDNLIFRFQLVTNALFDGNSVITNNGEINFSKFIPKQSNTSSVTSFTLSSPSKESQSTIQTDSESTFSEKKIKRSSTQEPTLSTTTNATTPSVDSSTEGKN